MTEETHHRFDVEGMDDHNLAEYEQKMAEVAAGEAKYQALVDARIKEAMARNEQRRIRRERMIDLMKLTLQQYNIEMTIQGCGCCGSPTVSFMHDGDYILKDEDNVTIDMIGEE